jgi:hypothetical protein
MFFTMALIRQKINQWTVKMIPARPKIIPDCHLRKSDIWVMSSAFVREGDHQDLQDIAPTMTALVSFLTNENGGIRVYEKKQVTNSTGDIVHMMSNGLGYRVNADSKWAIEGES